MISVEQSYWTAYWFFAAVAVLAVFVSVNRALRGDDNRNRCCDCLRFWTEECPAKKRPKPNTLSCRHYHRNSGMQ